MAVVRVEVGEPEGRRRWTVRGAGRILAAFSDGEQVVLVDGRCPHAGAPMGDGWLQDGQVVCPWHRYRFSPSDGTCLSNSQYTLVTYPTYVVDGRRLADVHSNPLGEGSYPEPKPLRTPPTDGRGGDDDRR
ncbi:Rieske (2Fe-2S) protein [Streptomyces sp. YKOK-I1]